MFPGNSISKEFACGRTKATAIIKACSNDSKEQLIQRMKQGPFILGTDGSQQGGVKYFPIVVRSLNNDGNRIQNELLSLPSCSESATGEAIFLSLTMSLKIMTLHGRIACH